MIIKTRLFEVSTPVKLHVYTYKFSIQLSRNLYIQWGPIWSSLNANDIGTRKHWFIYIREYRKYGR